MLRNLNQSVGGRRILGTPRIGVPAAEVMATAGQGPNGEDGLLVNDVLQGDPADCLYRVRFLDLPADGNLFVWEDGRFSFTGAPDGIYSGAQEVRKSGVTERGTYDFVVGTGIRTINCTVGNAVADGLTANISNGVTIHANVGDAVADGLTATIAQATTINCTVGNADASGETAVINNTAPRYARPLADIVTGPWMPSAGGSLGAMLGRPVPNDSGYIHATEAGSCEIRINPVADPGTSTGQVVRYRCWSDSGNGLTVRLKQGSTVIAQWTHASLPSVPTTYAQRLTASECDTITDYAALSFEFVAL